MSNDKISELKLLVTRLADSAAGYKNAAEKAEQDRHANLFTKLSDDRYHYALVIQDYLKRHGVEKDIESSFTGKTHRFLMDISSLMGDDEQLMKSIVSGESELLDDYRSALEEADIDPELIKILQAQYREIVAYLDIIDIKQKAA